MVSSRNFYIRWLMLSTFNWKKYWTNSTSSLTSYMPRYWPEWLYQSTMPFFNRSRLSGPLQPLVHPSSSGQRRGTMYLKRGLNFCSLILHPIPSLYRQQRRKPGNSTHAPPWQTKRQRNWTFLHRKVVSSASLQFCISNYLALFTKYDFLTYGKLADFADQLPRQD